MGTQDWLEVSVRVDGEAAEAVSQVLDRYVRGGAVIERMLIDGPGAHDDIDVLTVKGYIEIDDYEGRRKIQEALWHLGQLYPIPEPTFRVIAEADWSEAWKAHYAVLHVGQRTVIVPQWQDYTPQPGEVAVILDPGMAFGTGTHPTTRLCLAALEEVIRPGMRVLDLGTGSGVLAIAAARQGAAGVLALDNDSIAVDSARRNISFNGLGDVVQVRAGSFERAQGPYDLILVNILAQIIVDMLELGLADLLAPQGIMVASGIIDTQEDQVRHALAAHGLRVVERQAEHDWIALIADRIS